MSFNTFNNATVRTIASGDGFVMSIKGVLSIPANEGPIKTIWLYSHRFFPLDASFPRLISNELQRVVYQNPDTLLDVHNTFNSRDINWGCLEICRDPDSPIVINTFTLIPSLSIKFIDKESILPIDDKITLKATAGFPKKPLQMAVRYNRPQTRDGNLERPTTPI